MRCLLFLLSVTLFSSFSHAVEMSCAEVFSIHNRKPPANRSGGFQPTEIQVVQILREVQKFMDINVNNLRAKVSDPRVEDLVKRITGHRKPLRSVYNYAMTLHTYEWWIQRIGRTVEQVYKTRAPLTEEQIDTALLALMDQKLPVKIEAMRGNENPTYTEIISAALGFEVTANRVWVSARAYNKSWKMRVGTYKVPDPTYQISDAEVVNALVQLKLAGLDTSKEGMHNIELAPKMASIIYETTGQPFRPGALFTYVQVKLNIPWRILNLSALQRMKESPVHLLIAAFHKPSMPWDLNSRPTNEGLETMMGHLENFKYTLSNQERKVFTALVHFYSSNNEWNPSRLKEYVRLRTGINDQSIIDGVFAKIVASPELAQIASQL